MLHSQIDFGMTRQQFFEQCYDKNWFLQKNAFEANSFTWSDLDDALYSWQPQESEIRLFKDGPVAFDVFTESYFDISEKRTRIVKDVLYQYLKDGATLVLNKLQLHSPLIHDYSMSVAQFIGEKTNVNAYAAFGGNGSFGKHWDTHDVFVLQLSGRKHWKVYQPTFEQPLAHQKSTNHKADCPEIPVFDNVLEAGDLLYIPRGWWHEGLPMNDVRTFHIAVSSYPPRVIDYLIWLCASHLPNHVEGRQSLNAYQDVKTPVKRVADKLNLLLEDANNLQGFYQAYAAEQRIHSRFSIANLAKQYSETQEAQQKHSVRLNSFLPFESTQQNMVVNGFKINLDISSLDLLSNLNKNLHLINDEAPAVYSKSQQDLLRQLREFDVVEFIGR